MKKSNVVLLLLAICLSVYPLVMQSGAKFSGADDQLSEKISELNPDYKPWFQSLWEPPSGEVESLLFAVQAAIGAGFLGYYFGYYKGRRETMKHEEEERRDLIHDFK